MHSLIHLCTGIQIHCLYHTGSKNKTGAKTPCIGPYLVKVFMSPFLYTLMQDLMLCKCMLPNTAVK